jgi:hypothetical protein
MKKIFITILFLLSFFISGNQFAESKEIKKKPLLKFEEVNKDTGIYIIRYSNIIVTLEGKQIKVPIYGGIYEDITYENLKKQQTKTRSLLGHIYISAEDGQVKKTFFNILAFYKKSFFKDIDVNRPSAIGNEGGDSLFIWYDFEYEGMPCSMMITITYDSKATSEKIKKMKASKKKGEPLEETVDMLEFKEDSKWIDIQINLGEESGFKKKSK